jgi:hypothetical protein
MTTKKNTSHPKLNVYARNMRFINYEKDKKYLSKLTDFLADEEWLKVSSEKYKGFSMDRKYLDNKKMIGMKPGNVSWFSKGSWLFHDGMCCNLDSEIIYITVDYTNIYKISNLSPDSNLVTDKQYKNKLTKFNKKYILSKPRTKLVHKDNLWSGCEFIKKKEYCEDEDLLTGKLFGSEKEDNKSKKIKKVQCKWNNKTQRCGYRPCLKKSGNCVINYGYPYYKWGKFLKDYDGLAIYPIMTLEEMRKLQQHYGFDGWDVETLVLLNDKPITKHHNLGTIRELLNITKDKKLNSNDEINYSKLVSSLIKKIKEIRTQL